MPRPFFHFVIVAFCGVPAMVASGAPAAAHDPAVSPAISVAAPDARSWPFLGKWELDLTRMPSNYGPAPKRVLFSFDYAGAGLWRTTIDITAPDGAVRHSMVQYRREGQAFAGQGDQREADHAAFLSPTPNVLVMDLAKDKNQGSVRVYTVSEDGSEMTESAASIDSRGMPFVRIFHFKHLR